LIFIPREGEELPSIEEKGNKIVLKTKQITAKLYEITSPSAKGLAEYEPVLNAAVAAKSEGDSVLQSVDWLGKRSCVLVITGNLDPVLAALPGGPSALKTREVPGQPYLLSSEYVTDRFEFEGLADIVAGCVKEDDLLYLCFDWATKKNLMLFSTKDPGDRQKCLVAQDVYLEPA
jgi:hypothetical protein